MDEHEAKAISTYTKDALAAAKARGTRLGGDRGNLPAVAKEGAKASVAARIVKANNRASDLAAISEEMKGAGAVSLTDRGCVERQGGSRQHGAVSGMPLRVSGCCREQRVRAGLRSSPVRSEEPVPAFCTCCHVADNGLVEAVRNR